MANRMVCGAFLGSDMRAGAGPAGEGAASALPGTNPEKRTRSEAAKRYPASSRRREPTAGGRRRRRGRFPDCLRPTPAHALLPRPSRTGAFRALAVVLAAGAALAASDATAQTLPGAPRNLAAYAGDASATLTWDAPASDGGMSITKYQYRSATSDSSTDPPTLTWGAWTDFSGGDGNTRRGDVSGLTNGTAYTFEVRAVNGGGNGPASNQAAVTPTSTAVVNTWELSLSSDTIVEGGANVTATVRIASGPVFDADQSILLTWDDCHIGPNADILLPGVPCISGDVRGIGEGGYSKWIVILAGERAGSLLLTTFQRQQGLLDLYTAYPYDTYLVATLGTTEIGNQPLTYVDAAPKPEVTLQAVNMEVVEGERIQLRIRTPTPIGHVFSEILVSVTDDDSVLQNSFPNGQELDFANTRRRDFNPLSTDSTATTGAREVTFELQYADDDDHHFYTLGAAAPVTVTVLDKDTQANAPQDFKAEPGSGRVVLSWEAPAANGAVVEKYQYRESTDGGTNYGAWTDIPGGTDARGHDLMKTNGTAYTYQVRASNRAGGSTETEAKTATPMVATWGLTLTPTGGIGGAEAITEGGSGTVTADLSPNNAATFTEDQRFEVSWAGAPVDADNLVRGVDNKTTIVIRAGQRFGRLVLRAPDDPEGEGIYRPTAMENVTVTHGGEVIAEAPLALVDNEPKPVVAIAARSAFETEGLSLRFLATLTGKISEEVRVTAEVSNDPAGSLTTATSKNFRFSAGQVGDEYVIDTDENTTVDVLRKVTVTLTSNHADSEHYTLGEPSSVTVTVLDDDVAPGTPGNLTAEGGLNKVTLSWDGPTDGVAVSKYQYRVSDDGINFGAWTDVPGESSARSYAVRGLVTGNEYTFELHAVNAIGVSPRAGPVTKRVPSVPGPPGEPPGEIPRRRRHADLGRRGRRRLPHPPVRIPAEHRRRRQLGRLDGGSGQRAGHHGIHRSQPDQLHGPHLRGVGGEQQRQRRGVQSGHRVPRPVADGAGGVDDGGERPPGDAALDDAGGRRRLPHPPVRIPAEHRRRRQLGRLDGGSGQRRNHHGVHRYGPDQRDGLQLRGAGGDRGGSGRGGARDRDSAETPPAGGPALADPQFGRRQGRPAVVSAEAHWPPADRALRVPAGRGRQPVGPDSGQRAGRG